MAAANDEDYLWAKVRKDDGKTGFVPYAHLQKTPVAVTNEIKLRLIEPVADKTYYVSASNLRFR